ncbi:18703_t:CDS:2, partial [Gigaspora margarita]
ECSSSTKALTYPLGLENTNTDNNYTIEAQPYFDFENENIINSHEENTKNVIIGDPIHVKHKGRQPKCYRSEGEDLPRKKKLQNIQNTSTSNVAKSSTGSSNAKSMRRCQNCNQVIMHRDIQISANNDNCATYRYVTYDSIV